MKNISLVLMVLLSLVVARVYAQDSSETAKIQYLIASVEAAEGAKFIRNGREYDARSASEHLRLKLKVAAQDAERRKMEAGWGNLNQPLLFNRGTPSRERGDLCRSGGGVEDKPPSLRK